MGNHQFQDSKFNNHDAHLQGSLGEIVGQKTVDRISQAIQNGDKPMAGKFSLRSLRRYALPAILVAAGVGLGVALVVRNRSQSGSN